MAVAMAVDVIRHVTSPVSLYFLCFYGLSSPSLFPDLSINSKGKDPCFRGSGVFQGLFRGLFQGFRGSGVQGFSCRGLFFF